FVSGARLPGAGATHVAGPAHVQRAEPAVPAAGLVPVEGPQPRAGEAGPGGQHDIDLGRTLPCLSPASCRLPKENAGVRTVRGGCRPTGPGAAEAAERPAPRGQMLKR